MASFVSGVVSGVKKWIALPLAVSLGGLGADNSASNGIPVFTAGIVAVTTTPNIGTPAAGVLTNCTGLPVAGGGTGQSSYTNGQLLIGNTTGNTLSKATLTGTTNQVVVTNGAGSITLSLPQSIATSSSPTFAGLTLTSIATFASSLVSVSQPMSISKSYTDGANGAYILNISATGNTITANTANILYGIQNDVRLNQASFNATSGQAITAAYNTASASGTSGTVTGVVANMGRAGNSSTAIVTTASVFYAMQALNFAGGTLTNWRGFYCEPSTAATNNYAFQGQIASGTGRYNLYMDGTADNYLAGSLGIGTVVNSATRLLDGAKSFTDPAATSIVMNFSSTSSITANNSQSIVGVQGDVRINQGGFTFSGGLRGVTASAYANGASGTAGQLACLYGQAGNLGAGTVTAAYFAFAQGALNSGGGGLGTFTAYHCDPQTAGTTIYGFRGQIASTSGRWNIYMDGTAANHMAGELMLGTTTSGSAALTIGDSKNIAFGTTTGTSLGTAVGQKVSVYGVTPIVQRSGAAQVAVATTSSTQTTPWGFASQAQADSIITLVNELRASLVAFGVIKGAA